MMIMISIDQKRKEDFEKIWDNKLENSKYNLIEYGLFSNRQIHIWNTVKLKTVEWSFITGKVVKKPSYIDRFWKARYRGYIVLQNESKDIIIAHVDNVFKK